MNKLQMMERETASGGVEGEVGVASPPVLISKSSNEDEKPPATIVA